MERVTVVVREGVVIIRGRDGAGVVRAVETVPLQEMSDAHIEKMRRRHTD